MSVTYFTPGPADAVALSAMAIEAFVDTFREKLDPEGMRLYLEEAYGENGVMARDLADPRVGWRAARDGETIIGYIKITPLLLDVPDAARGALELRQLYVLQRWHGTGIAGALTEWGIAAMRAEGAPGAYLAVFDDNHRARRFYERHGFCEVGHTPFTLGAHRYADYVMMLAL